MIEGDFEFYCGDFLYMFVDLWFFEIDSFSLRVDWIGIEVGEWVGEIWCVGCLKVRIILKSCIVVWVFVVIMEFFF